MAVARSHRGVSRLLVVILVSLLVSDTVSPSALAGAGLKVRHRGLEIDLGALESSSGLVAVAIHCRLIR